MLPVVGRMSPYDWHVRCLSAFAFASATVVSVVCRRLHLCRLVRVRALLPCVCLLHVRACAGVCVRVHTCGSGAHVRAIVPISKSTIGALER